VNLKTSHGTQFIIAHPVYNFLVLNSAKFQATVTLDKVKKISNPTVGGSCCILFLKNFRIECRIMALILRREQTTRDSPISVIGSKMGVSEIHPRQRYFSEEGG